MVISTAIGLFSGIILIPQILAPHLTTKATTTPIKNNHQQDWRLLKSLLSIELGFGLVSIATLNPSLSVFLAVPTTPILMLIATHSSSTLVRIIKTLIVGCVCSPPLLVLLACIAESLLLSGGGDGLVSSSLATSVTIIDGAIYNWNVFGAWLYPFICLFYWPVVIATTTLTRFIWKQK